MIQIDRHIEVLLLDNDCVIVPDLGGFMAYHVPARYVKETGQFVPPSRQLGFNAQLKINDSLLAQSYIEAYDISYPEALRRIEAEVEEMNQLIQNTGMCELNDIGVLRLNEQGNMEFEPCEAGILTPGLYALNTLDMLPLTHKVVVEKKPVIDVAKPVRKENKNEITETPIVPAPINIVAKNDVAVDDDDEEKHSLINFEVVKRIAAVAAVIVSLFVIVMPFGSSSQEGLTRSYLDSGFLYNLVAEKPDAPEVKMVPKTETKPAEIKTEANKAETKIVAEQPAENNTADVAKTVETAKAEAKVEKNTAEAKKEVKADTKADTKDNVKKAGSYYAIVIASCIPHNNAVDAAKKLSQSGLKDATVVDRSNGSKVVYGHYASDEEARNALRSLRTKDNTFAKGWVMKF